MPQTVERNNVKIIMLQKLKDIIIFFQQKDMEARSRKNIEIVKQLLYLGILCGFLMRVDSIGLKKSMEIRKYWQETP